MLPPFCFIILKKVIPIDKGEGNSFLENSLTVSGKYL